MEKDKRKKEKKQKISKQSYFLVSKKCDWYNSGIGEIMPPFVGIGTAW
ncbi:hypothetical protein JWG39_12485 [Desulforhopalus vacuolatus]|nr:hypothetical protein [Desulforhopalus vacuolatus]MBM9520632.1 hypothetical protein [Desulforhopalus vacuolatus]